MNIIDLTYNFPQAAYFLLLVPVFLILAWFFYQHKQKVLSQYTSKDKLSSLSIQQTQINYWLRVAGYCLIWTLLCFAFMQPKGNPRYPQNMAQKQNESVVRMQPHEVIFMLDASASMMVPDGRLGQARLDNAKDVADQIMARLQGQSGSLYAFTSDVSKLSPPSMDYLYMRLMLHSLTINEGDMTGTDIKAAMQYIKDNYLAKPTPLIKTLVIISDGEDNKLQELDGRAKDAYVAEIAALLGDPVSNKLQVYTIGVGTFKGGEVPNVTYNGSSVTSRLDETLLRELADKGMGRYYMGAEYAAVDIADDISQRIAKVDQFSTVNTANAIDPNEDLVYDAYYKYPLGLALLLLPFYLFWPETGILRRALLTRCLPLFLSFFLASSLNAAGKEDQLALAQAYYKTGAYNEGISLYQALLKENLSAWERTVVVYNLGTTRIQQGEYDSGIDLLQSIPLDHDTSPLAAYRILSNLTMANFRLADQMNNSLDTTNKNNLDTYYKAIYYYKKALERVAETKAAKCVLWKAVGEFECPEDMNLNQIESLSHEKVANLLQGARDYLVQNADLKNGIPWLLAGLQLLQNDLAFLADNHMSYRTEADYKELVEKHAQSWQPLWKSFSKMGSAYKEFGAAEDSYNKVLSDISGRDFANAKEQLNLSTQWLNALLKLLYADDSFQVIISKIENDFSLAALQEPLEVNSLIYLSQTLKEVTLPADKNVFKVGFDAIKDNLERSIAMLENHLTTMGNIYFDEAHQQLKRVILTMNPHVGSDPELILQAAIDEQRHALTQTRLLSQLKENDLDKNYQAALVFATASQDYISAFSDYFYNSAYKRQMALFNAAVPEGKEDLRCQYHPWNEVFPMFQKGLQLALKASKELKARELDLNNTISVQETIIGIWKNTLVKLGEPPQKGGCNVSAKANQQATTFDNIARQIQLMNYEDQQVKTQPAEPLKEGLRSW